MIREIDVSLVTEVVKRLSITANKVLPKSIEREICRSCSIETVCLAKSIMNDIKENLVAASELDLPICQDTGMAVIFLKIGQDIHFTGGDLYAAINKGVSLGYTEGLLRKSVVSDPLNRVNSNDNTPAVIHTEIVSGSKVEITLAPKGFGSENMSAIKMLTPAQSKQGVVDFVLETVKKAGGNPCPPMVIGVGIGGDFEQVALLSKKALLRDLGTKNSNEIYAQLENELLEKVNELGVGPQGFGGKTTALGLNIEYAPTHIAGLPVAVNIGCYVTRHCTEII